jgi:hypothetical protein
MFGLIFKGFFFLFVMFWYTVGIWNLVNNYFRDELQKYLLSESTSKLNSQLEKLTNHETTSESHKGAEHYCSIIEMYTVNKNVLDKNAICYPTINNKQNTQKCHMLSLV